MQGSFLYDTHYQVDKPLALFDLTLATASPTVHATDDALARRLAKNALSRARSAGDTAAGWAINPDAMKYWIGTCHETRLLSRQNSYDYWLLNFEWLGAFSASEPWGYVPGPLVTEARLLVFRWGWIFDAPMLAATLWTAERLGKCDSALIVDVNNRHVEEILSAANRGLREISADIRMRSHYRAAIARLQAEHLRPNTRRHKLAIHLGILGDAGLVDPKGGLAPGLADAIKRYGGIDEIVAASLRGGPLGPGLDLFCALSGRRYSLGGETLTDAFWEQVRPDLFRYWGRIERWDRKFLSIPALAELFVVRNLLAGQAVFSTAAWKTYLTDRARRFPEELTVHVGRFGEVEFLRFTAPPS